MTPLKRRFLRAFAGSALGAVTGAVVAALCMAVSLLIGIIRKEPWTQGLGISDLGMLSLVAGLLASTVGVLWGTLFGAIFGFCDFDRVPNMLLGLAFGGVFCWYLSHSFSGFPLALQLACFPLMGGACFLGPLFINRFIK